ncbi:putative periplasmic lipoprotein [Flavobacterium selenitireducens]|uniref:hypothetical protein n=1 Tax=Flavobacterium selenitireducens TaxID=2722704 RepID=UPI00168B0EB0|nr:hypothetical protein [Flavobacterium selenitireducens]MBD3581635.1 hypothetical protein [Flavobacterium selenitireducens]
MKSLEKLRMKKLLFFFLLAITVTACVPDDTPKSDEFALVVEDATVPASMVSGQMATIQVKYRRPTDCHIFNGFYIDSDGFTQTISVRSLKFNDSNCNDDSETLYDVPLNFMPSQAGTYRFKFWKGQDGNGAPIFIEFESVVE